MSIKMPNRQSSKFYVNTDHFQPNDLDLFVESMEIIARIERERIEKRKGQKEERFSQINFNANTEVKKTRQEITQDNRKQQLSHCADHEVISTIAQIPPAKPKSISIPQIVTERYQSVEETMDEPVTHLEAKQLYFNEADENYYSGHESNDNSPCNSVIMRDMKSKNLSDSEESGVFPVGEPYLFQNNMPLRPRAEVIRKSNTLSPRSEIISLAIKRHLDSESISTSLEQELALSEDILLAVERCDRALAEVMNQKYNGSNGITKKESHRQGFALESNSIEEHFLDQALSLLKL